jgi:hypothetical protein
MASASGRCESTSAGAPTRVMPHKAVSLTTVAARRSGGGEIAPKRGSCAWMAGTARPAMATPRTGAGGGRSSSDSRASATNTEASTVGAATVTSRASAPRGASRSVTVSPAQARPRVSMRAHIRPAAPRRMNESGSLESSR